MTFSLYEEFSRFHIFKGFKTVLSEWWHLDIFLIEKSRKGGFYYSPKTQIHNPITKTLLSSDIFRGDFIQSLSLLSKQNLESHKIYTLPWKQVDLEIFAIPVLVNDSLEGFVVATGFMPHNRERLSSVLDYLKKEKSWQETEMARLEKPTQRDLTYLKKLLCILVNESFSLYKYKKEQEELIESLKMSANKPEQLVGRSPAMQFLYNVLDKIKDSEKPLLIQGEPGVGKKLIARVIHEISPRRSGFFHILDCSSLNDSALKAELFKGGPPKNKTGLLQKAHNGTLVLDKTESLSLDLQAKILQFLEEGRFFSPDNLREAKESKARILALSSANLKEAVEEKTFRQDLFYALNVMNFKIPALRDRSEDIPLLINSFLKIRFPNRNKKFSSQIMKHFFNYSWPGNVRELQSEIEKMIILSGNESLITEKHLPAKIYTSEFHLPENPVSLKQVVDDFEKRFILNCLNQESWNKSAVAKKLNLSRTSLVYKTKIYGLLKKKENS